MANTLGGSSKRTKICYDNDGIQACNEYFAVTNLETNKVEWHRDDKFRAPAFAGWSLGETTVIGEYDPKTKKFTPNDKALASQAKYFTSKEGTNQIAQITKTTNTKSLVENGKTPEEAQQEAEELSNGNFENTNPDNTKYEGSSSSVADTNEDNINTRNDFGKEALTYPLKLSSTQDTLKFQMIKYVAKGFKSNGNWGGINRDKAGVGERDILGTVILPIPGGIKDSAKVEWGANDMNAIDIALSEFASDSIKGGLPGAQKSIENSVSALKNTGGGSLKEMVTSAFTAAAIGKDFKSIMARSTGRILNPNMELLFNGPSLRPFSFNFLLAPRSKDEAMEVMKIIRFFKQGMAPIRSKANLFLKSPHTFQLQYRHKDDNHPYLNSFKECALESCEVNYTPEQSYSTYEDGVMTAYTLSLGFKELEPVYNDDYGNVGGLPSNLNFESEQTSTIPGTTDYNTNSGYAPGYAPGDNKGNSPITGKPIDTSKGGSFI